MADISPQGYSYGKEPTSTNPFWDNEKLVVPDISADATVDETTGTPAVEVEKTQNGTDVQFSFAFSGLKGEQGEQGPRGEQGDTGATGPAPTVTSTGSTEAGALAGTITGDDGTVINVYNGSGGGGSLNLPDNAFKIYVLQENRPSESSYAYAEWHLYHLTQYDKAGNLQTTANQDIYIRIPNYLKTYTGLTLTNENGVYTLTGRKPITASPYYAEEVIGTIEVPDVDTENVLAEIADTVVSNDSIGYDFHTIKETEYNGTQNEVGKFYIAQNQITGVSQTNGDTVKVALSAVTQEGTELSDAITLMNSKVISGSASLRIPTKNQVVAITMSFNGGAVPVTKKRFSIPNPGYSASDIVLGHYYFPLVFLMTQNTDAGNIEPAIVSLELDMQAQGYNVSSGMLYSVAITGYMISRMEIGDIGLELSI